MRIGSPFKMRWTGRPSPGMLSTPDILKFHVPVPFAFVPVNCRYDPRTKKECCTPNKKKSLVSAGSYKITEECQKMVNSYNNCLKNNMKDPGACEYYFNYLSSSCRLTN
jgi:hypothetical protein